MLADLLAAGSITAVSLAVTAGFAFLATKAMDNGRKLRLEEMPTTWSPRLQRRVNRRIAR